MIRQATTSDIPRLLSLLEQVLQVHHRLRPDLFKGQGGKFSQQDLEEMLLDDKRPIFVYEDDKGEVQGHLFMILEEDQSPAMLPHKTLFIDDLCVDETARNQKIGEQLYQFALAKAREWGCYNLTLNVWNANQAALRFYQRMGMLPQEMRMEALVMPEEKI